MYFPLRCPSSFFLVATAVILPSFAGAQSLEHRSFKPNPEPAKPAGVTPAEPVLPKGTSLQVEISRHYPVKSVSLLRRT